MTAIASDLLNWIFHPIQRLENAQKWSRPTIWTTTALISLATVSDWGITSIGEAIFCVAAYCLLLFSWLFVLAVSADFWAQGLGKKAQSLTLFSWLLMAQLPLVLCMPLSLLSDILPSLSWLFTLGTIACILYTAWLQIRILMHHYKLSFILGLLFMGAPFLFVLIVPAVLSAAGILWGVMG